jgi:protein-tyrosine-phosphatase/DNA-binding transcriptional ArsR family regulator
MRIIHQFGLMYSTWVTWTPESNPATEPPVFLALAGHPLRWQLLRELAESDRRVRELTVRVGERQSLVSYHLGLLRAARLVSARPSSADRRDSYYSADLARCGELLGVAGAALHPALGPELPRFGASEAVSGRVLFLCTGNSARSQMAEGWLQHLTGDDVQAFSAGSHPTQVHPNAVRVMRAHGIDLRGRRAKHYGEFLDQRFDCVVTVCDRVREVCPEFPGARTVHWSIPDPVESGGTDAATYPAFERAAHDIAGRIPFLMQLLAHDLMGVN